MTRREELQERYEDALFALMMDEVAVSEGKKALEENERLQNDPDAEVPEDVSKRCEKTIRRYFIKQKAKTAGRVTVKAFSKVALVAGICSILFTVAFASFETVRINTMNLVVQVFGESTDFYFDSKQTTDTVSDVTVGWLPDGYAMKDQGGDNFDTWYLYQKSDTEIIKIKYMLSDGTVLSVDTEDAKTENIDIDGAQAMLVTKGDEQQIVWGTTDKTAFIWVLGTGVTRDELIHVANELKY